MIKSKHDDLTMSGPNNPGTHSLPELIKNNLTIYTKISNLPSLSTWKERICEINTHVKEFKPLFSGLKKMPVLKYSSPSVDGKRTIVITEKYSNLDNDSFDWKNRDPNQSLNISFPSHEGPCYISNASIKVFENEDDNLCRKAIKLKLNIVMLVPCSPSRVKNEKFCKSISSYLKKLCSVSPQVGGFFNLRPDVLDTANEFFEDAVETLPAITSSVENINDLISQLRQYIGDDANISESIYKALEKTIGNQFGNYDSNMMPALTTVSLITAIVNLYYSKEESRYGYLGLAIAAFVLINRKRFGTFLSDCVKLITNYHTPNPQLGLDTIMEGATLALLSVFGNVPTIPKHLLPLLTNFDRVKTSLTSIVTFFVKIVQDMLTGVGLESLVPASFKYIFINNEKVLAYAKDVDLIQEQLLQRKFELSLDNQQIVNRLLEEGQKLILNLPTQTKSGGCGIIINNSIKMLASIKAEFTKSCMGDGGRRPTPVAVLLQSGPGNGKTEVVDHLVAAIMAKTASAVELEKFKKDSRDYNFVVSPDDQFWSGYKGQLFTNFNDFAQATDIPGPSSEILRFMKCVDSTPFPLTMAAINDKGNTHFISRYVIASTNQTSFNHTPSITDVGALKRRFHFTYLCVVKEKYSFPSTSLWNRKMDSSKLPIGVLDETSLTPEIMEFYPTNIHSSDILSGLGKPVEFDVVVDEIISRRKKFDNFYHQKSLEIMDTIRRHTRQEMADTEILQMEEINVFPQGGYLDQVIGCLKDIAYVPKLTRYHNFPSEYQESILNFYEFLILNPLDADSICFTRFYERAYNLLYARDNVQYDELTILIMIYSAIGSSGFLDVLRGENRLHEVIDYGRRNEFNTRLGLGRGFGSTSLPTREDILESFFDITQNEYRLSFKLFLGAAVAFLGVYPLVTNVVKMFRGLKPVAESQSMPKIKEKPKFSNKPIPQMGAGYDPNGEVIVEKILRTNYFVISYHKESVEHRIGGILALNARHVLMPLHYYNFIKSCVEDETESLTLDSIITVYKYNNTQLAINCYLTAKDFLDTPLLHNNMMNSDQIILHIKNVKFPICRDITEFIASKKNVSNLPSQIPIKLCGASQNFFSSFSAIANYLEGVPVSNPDFEPYKIAKAFAYSCATVQGDCGALMMVYNAKCKAKIFGMHVAGAVYNGVGYSTVLFLEDIREILDNEVMIIEEPQPQLGCNASIKIPNHMTYLGSVSKGIYHSSKSQIVPSLLHSAWESSIMLPAVLNREAFNLALHKYSIASSLPMQVRIDTINIIMHNVFDNLCSSSKKITKRVVYTVERAVMGDPDFENSSPISRSTSPGYPYVLQNKGYPTAKAKWFGVGQDFYFTEDGLILKQEILEIVSKLSDNVRVFSLYVDHLKDERRPISKIESKKTRMFSGINLSFFIIVRMYFGAFVEWLIANRIYNSCAPGTNVYSLEWNLIVHKFKEIYNIYSQVFTAGDFSGFDCSGKREVYFAMVDCINTWYNGSIQDNNVRTMLMVELTHSRHLRGKDVYEWDNSLPSGHPLTVYVNCIYNLFSLQYCWFRAHNNTLESLIDFTKYVYPIVYGDDNNCIVHPDKIQVYNEYSISKYMAELSLTYTSDTKSDFLAGTRNLCDITFLKRRYQFDDETRVYIAPIELDVILNIPKWTQKGLLSVQITKDNVDTALRELSLHNRHVFDKYSVAIIDASVSILNYHPESTNFRVLRAKVRNASVFI